MGNATIGKKFTLIRNNAPNKSIKTRNTKCTDTRDPFYDLCNIKEIERRIRDIESGKAHLSEHELIEVD